MLRAILALLPALALAQPAFEAASIKPNTTADKGSNWRVGPGGLSVNNMPIDQIIRAAYGLQDYQYSGPAWLENERFNIEAKPAGKVDGEQMRAMFQNLLADRFHLTVHRETRSIAGYALVVAKNGLKIHPAEGEGWNMKTSKTHAAVTHASMPQIATFLATVLVRPVADETGVKDSFTFTLDYADPRSPDPEKDTLPTIFTALGEQLGLRLETRKIPVEVLLVDRVERPSEN
jgi:uncharacterized protein (TIGR03435 family)